MNNNIQITFPSHSGLKVYDIENIKQLAEEKDLLQAIANGNARITQISIEILTTSPREIRQIIRERDSCFTVEEALDQVYCFTPSPTRLERSGQKRICFWDMPVPHFVNSVWALGKIAVKLNYFFMPCMAGLYDNVKIHLDIGPLDSQEKYICDMRKLLG